MNLSLGYLLVEHIVKVIIAIMAEALEDLERSELENAAEVPNMDNNMTTCTCRGICMRERGRNFCPCKNLGSFCSSSCHGDNFGRCMNNRRAQESDSDQTDSESSMEESEEEDVGRRGRGRARGRGRGCARGRGQQRGGRGRGRRGGRGRGQLVEEEQAAENVANHEQQLVNIVQAMDVDALRAFALELLRRQPAAFADLVNGELPGGNAPPQPDPEPVDNVPDWCNCGHCVAMPTQLENRCCTRAIRPCISTVPLFQQLVLDGNVLNIAMRYRGLSCFKQCKEQ